MLTEKVPFTRIYIATGYTDLRAGIDGLAALVKQKFELDPFQAGTLFLFCGRRRDRFKGLVWCGDGFLLLYKRIESGYVQWPRHSNEMTMISAEDFRKLLDGFQILQKSSIKEPSCSRIA